MIQPLLELLAVSKTYPGVKALDRVGLQVGRGEVLALIGENGAGKSTLMKILGGVVAPSEGAIRIDGVEHAALTVAGAMAAGIAFVHQELNLFDNLDVAANVMIGREPVFGGPLRLIDRRALEGKVTPLLRRLGADFETHTPVADLSLAQCQLVEIAKALSLDARIVIMDEPTSSLTASETARLLKVIGELKAGGVSVIFISHRLNEVEHCADRVVVLRDGAVVGELARDEIRHDTMIRMMIGRDLRSLYIPPARPPGGPVLEVAGLRTMAHQDQPLDLALLSGEILGMAGLVGAGRTELACAIFGVDRVVGGTIRLDGEPVAIRSPRDAIDRGIFLVPEDRKRSGLVLEQSVNDNISLPNLMAFASGLLIRRGAERGNATGQRAALDIRTASIDTIVGTLSGGNQQKVVLAKWLSMKPRLVIFDEPTRGIDVGSKVRDLPPDARIGRCGRCRAHDLERHGRGDRRQRSHRGDARGSHRRLPRPDGIQRGERDAAGGRAARHARGGGCIVLKKDLGLFLLIVVVGSVVAILNPRFLSPINLGNTANLIGLFGLFSLGEGIVIITGGIELSIGSIFALLGVIFVDLLVTWQLPWWLAVIVVVLGGIVLGAIHGFLVTRLKLQPFIVTLCGLLIYRGIARYYTNDGTAGFEFGQSFPMLEWLTAGRTLGVPHSFLMFLVVAGVMAVVLHRSVFGRYLFAVGKNEEAARYSGIRTTRVIAAAYIICGALAGLSSIYLAMYTRSISPASHGNFYELYGIAAAVLGGCSLRGGEGSILGIVLGVILLQVLQNLVNLLGIPSSLNFAVMGGVILIGVLADQQLTRYRNRRTRIHALPDRERPARS